MEDLGWLVGRMLIRAVIASLFGAVFLRAAASWIAKKSVPYGTAYSIYFVNHVIAGSMMILLMLVLAPIMLPEDAASIGWPLTLMCFGIAVPCSFLISSWIIGLTLGLKYRTAVLVTAATYGLAVAVFGTVSILASIALAE